MHHLQDFTTTDHTVLQAELNGTIEYEIFFICTFTKIIFRKIITTW